MNIGKSFFPLVCVLSLVMTGCQYPKVSCDRRDYMTEIVPVRADLGLFLQEDLPHITDRLVIARSLQRTLEHGGSGASVHWKNRTTQYEGDIIPLPLFLNEDKKSCRNFILSIFHKGNINFHEGSACRADEGVWDVLKVVKSHKH
jgi:hypothetical protein